MAPSKPSTTRAPRRSGRLAQVADNPLPVADDNRITKPAPPKTPRFDCSTCSRTLAASAFFKRLPTKDCKHEVHTCKSCLKSWLTMQLESTTYDKLSCPECPEIMSNADVKRVATKETYAKYDEIERRAFQEKTPGWRWCLAPSCRAGQVHKPLLEISANVESPGKKTRKGSKTKNKKTAAAEDICTCDTCGAKACVSCDRPYHEGETCAQYQKRVKRQTGQEETASMARIESSCKKCPKCERNIEKNGGCDQVHCSQCGESFCWLCLTPYRVINKEGHAASCTYAKADRFDPHAAQNAPGNGGAAFVFMFGLGQGVNAAV